MRWGVIVLLVIGCGPGERPPANPTRSVEPRAAAVLKDNVPIARLLVDAGIRQTTKRGASPMTCENGPSAAMFAYPTSIGVSGDRMTDRAALEETAAAIEKRKAP